MKLHHPLSRQRKASELASKDVISRMPENVINDILDRLPIQDAVRTSILSKNWRFKWTLLTQLVFDDKFFNHNSPSTQGKSCHIGKNISRILLHLRGDITKFVIKLPDSRMLDDEDINHWVMFLYRIGIKDFTLLVTGDPVRLPTHLLSCVELKHLKLRKCCFPPMSSFCGFPNLLSLDLYYVKLASCKDWEFIARCPLLETLTIRQIFLREGFFQLDVIAKLENLKTLSLGMGVLDSMGLTTVSIVFWFIGSLQTLEELTLEFWGCMFVKQAGDRKRVPIILPCLKTLILVDITFSSDIEVSCVFEMIRGSPNLHTLKIKGVLYKVDPAHVIYSSDWWTLGQLQLRDVVLGSIKGSESEVRLIKFLLASSPLLKEMVIHSRSSQDADKKLELATKLLKLQRASPRAEIVLY